jgi:LmbE family N-acetylglucosaminyl deacetylase
MFIEDLGRARAGYRHVYLSPHLDDAALSCGGRIVTQLAAGEPVLVVTFCTAAPPAAGPFSDLARQFHADWGLTPDRAVGARLDEDRLAMERLGCDYHWAGALDAIYRFPEAYNSRESLFGTPATADPMFATVRGLVGDLGARFPGATFYAPLGVGSHVDHLVTFAAVRELLGTGAWFFEDLHYVARPGALEERMAGIADRLEAAAIAIDAALQTKVSAIHAYASQLGELFGGPEAMEATIAAYAHLVRPAGAEYGERVWRVAA